MTIDDVFVIKGRGIVVAGWVERGVLRKGDTVRLIGGSKPEFTATVSGLDIFHRPPNAPIGILLRGVELEQVEEGMIVTTEGLED